MGPVLQRLAVDVVFFHFRVIHPKIVEVLNSIDPDEVAPNELPHRDPNLVFEISV